MNYADLKFKLKNYPNVEYNMLQHSVFHDLLSKASDEQLDYMEDFFDEEVEIIFSDSRAGTGKTFITVACCYADYLNKGKQMHFVIAPLPNDIGLLPGSQFSKEKVYFQGLYDALLDLNLDPERAIYEAMGDTENIESNAFDECWVTANSHTFLRGSNINCNLICEESQNFKRNELKKVLTRVKSGSTVCVIGSSIQIDLKQESKSGFVPYKEWFSKYPGFREHTLKINYRSSLANYADDFTS